MIDAKLSAKELIRQCESYQGDQRFLDAVVNIASIEGSPIHWKPSRSSCRLILASGITHDIKHFPSDFDLENDPQWQAFSRQCRKDVAKCLVDWLNDLDRKPAVDVDDVEQEQADKPKPITKPRYNWDDICEQSLQMIRQDARRHGWTCTQWAEAFGVSRSAFSRSPAWTQIQYLSEQHKVERIEKL